MRREHAADCGESCIGSRQLRGGRFTPRGVQTRNIKWPSVRWQVPLTAPDGHSYRLWLVYAIHRTRIRSFRYSREIDKCVFVCMPAPDSSAFHLFSPIINLGLFGQSWPVGFTISRRQTVPLVSAPESSGRPDSQSLQTVRRSTAFRRGQKLFGKPEIEKGEMRHRISLLSENFAISHFSSK